MVAAQTDTHFRREAAEAVCAWDWRGMAHDAHCHWEDPGIGDGVTWIGTFPRLKGSGGGGRNARHLEETER